MTAWLKSAVRGVVHTALGPAERRLLAAHRTDRWPHVFILGAPRSGTSLFYELLVTRYQLAHFTNLAHRFWKTPVAATRLGLRAIRNRRPVYQSSYGHVAGWTAPNEGGWIWHRWLDDGPWVDESALQAGTAREMRATLGALSDLFAAPFVNKNVMHSNRVRLLDAAFPGCLFVEVRRDPLETARSIVRAQKRGKGPAQDADEWWSVRPSGAGGADVLERACRQVTGVADDIARDCAHVGGDRLHVLDFAALCADPERELTAVAGFLRAHGADVADRAPVPGHFDTSPQRPLSDAEEARLATLLDGFAYAR